MRSYTLREGEPVRIFTSSTTTWSPFPSRGRTISRLRWSEVFSVERSGLIHASRKWAPGVGSETPDCRRDHLIHRGAVPLPLRGATADAVLTSSTTNVVPLPLIGEGLSALE